MVGAVSTVPLTLYVTKDPILLENRTKAGPTAEHRPLQKIIVACIAIPYIAAPIVPGLDYRFGWSSVPLWLSVVGDLSIIIAMWMGYRVFKENSYGYVITTGPYAIARNPMYSSAAVYFIGMSLALGSYWGLIPPRRDPRFRLAIVRRRKVPYSKSSRLYGLLHESSLASDTWHFLERFPVARN
jgi:protein-S-isoprenylcysteine O-methyltransferase Ste14